MSVNNILDTILQQRRQSSGELAEYLLSTFQTAGLHVQKQVFFYSLKGHLLVGGAAVILSAVFVFAVLKRKFRLTVATALAVPVLLFLEFSAYLPVASWPVLKKGENIVVQFPVQNASQRVILATQYGAEKPERWGPSSRLEATLSAFLKPAALALLVMGIWHLVSRFGKLEFEDFRTVMLVMGVLCTGYFAAWTGTVGTKPVSSDQVEDTGYNADSIALLSELALNMGKKEMRLENTWVSIVFFGGSAGQGARPYERQLARYRAHSLEAIVIDCREIGSGSEMALVVPLQGVESSFVSSEELARLFSSAAAAVVHRPAQISVADADEVGGTWSQTYPCVVFTCVPPGGAKAASPGKSEIETAHVSAAVEVLEKFLVDLDAEQLRHRLPLLQPR